MESPNVEIESLLQKVEANIANWQSSDFPLAPLSDDQNEILYLIEDEVKRTFYDLPKQCVQPKYSIDTYEAYIKWMVRVENEIREEALKDQILYFDKLSTRSTHLKDLVNSLEDVGRALDLLASNYQEISTNITSLRLAIDDVSKQIVKLKDTKEKISGNLRHYQVYSFLHNKIKQSARVSNDFKNVLMQIDDSLDYFAKHPNFKESYKFSEKFNKLLLMCLGKIGYCVEQTITATTSEISGIYDLLCSQQERIDPMFLYYGKFQSVGCKFVLLINHIEENGEKNYLYKETLIHCQKVFFAQRSLIMKPGLFAALNDLVKTYKNQLFILFRSCCSFVLKVCHDELTCFGYFFKVESTQLDAYLEALCQQLYDTLRPCLIKINHLEILTELCVVLKGKLNENITIKRFTNILSQLVGDLEERIVFRANIFFEQDLLQYKPSPGDLSYPEKLHQLNTNTNQNSVVDLHGMWYPTVKRTLVCLSLLYFCLKKHLFQSLSREALIICAKTLEVAACSISVKKNNLNGRLFQIKHLLILREQISPFNFDNDPILGTKTIKSSIFSSTAILEFLLGENSTLREYSVDPKKEINKELKAACEDFINHATAFLTENMICWMREVKDVLKGNETMGTEDFSKASYVAEVVNVVQKNIKRRIPELKQLMKLYLANRENEMILFRLVKNKVLSIFLQMEEILRLGKYSPEDLLLIACPTSEQVNVLICSVCLTF